MPHSRSARRAIPIALAALALAPATPAAADQVVADNQIVQGHQCVGAPCVDGESGAIPLKLKTTNTPAIRLEQTNGGGWLPYTWDVAANEANFFVRDISNGNALPLRIFPGAPTDSLRIESSGGVTTQGVLEQRVDDGRITGQGPADAAAILDALRSLPLDRYRVDSDPGAVTHVAPLGDAFHSAFDIGVPHRIAATDVSGVALAAIKALDARVTEISLTPGPRGASGPQGSPGPAGPAGARGPAGGGDGMASKGVNRSLKRANKRIRKLARSNRRLAKGLRRLRKQVARLAPDR